MFQWSHIPGYRTGPVSVSGPDSEKARAMRVSICTIRRRTARPVDLCGVRYQVQDKDDFEDRSALRRRPSRDLVETALVPSRVLTGSLGDVQGNRDRRSLKLVSKPRSSFG